MTTGMSMDDMRYQLHTSAAEPMFERWNATSYAHLLAVVAGHNMGGDGDGPLPDPEMREAAARLVERALACIPWGLEWLQSSRLIHARRCSRAILAMYRKDPTHVATPEELKAFSAQYGSIK